MKLPFGVPSLSLFYTSLEMNIISISSHTQGIILALLEHVLNHRLQPP